MDDKIYSEIYKLSELQYKEFLDLFKTSGNEKDYDKFITLLFKDIVKIYTSKDSKNIITINNKNKYIEIIENPIFCISFFDNYNEKLKYIQSNNSSTFLNKIKEIIQQQNKSLLKKIAECKEHLEIIKKYYIHLIISEKVSFNDTSELSFKNKTVLTSNNNIENLEIGEVFTRYIFYYLFNKSVEPQKNEFYNNIFNFINSGNLNFKDWPFQVKYFILIIFLINLLFNSNSNYNEIFNEKTLKNNINELKKIEKPKNNSSKKQKQKQKHKGGGKKQIKIKKGNALKIFGEESPTKNSNKKTNYNDGWKGC